MPIFTVGPNSTFPTIAAAMAAAGSGDTIQLESGYGSEMASVTHNGMTLTGDATSTGVVLQLASGVVTFDLGGTAPVYVLDSPDGNQINGNDGDDVIQVSGGADAVSGGPGADRLVVDYSQATGAVTGDGTSNFAEAGGGGRLVTINGGFETFTVFTGSGADTITTGAGDDYINTGNGAGTVTAGQGANTIIGGNGADTFTALDGGNFMDGGDGANTLTSGGGADDIRSGFGSDTIVAGGGADLVTVRGGLDTVDLGADSDRLIVDYSTAVTSVTTGPLTGTLLSGYTGSVSDLAANQVNYVGAENLTITSGSANDVLTTGDGNDVLNGGAGADRMTGGNGNDVYYVDNVGDKVLDGTDGGFDTVYSSADISLVSNRIEELFLTGSADIDAMGGKLANRMTGNSGANELNGSAGDDTITGGAGADTMDGGAGADSLIGGAGADVFLFDTPLGTGIDHIANFSHVSHSIELDQAVFTALDLGTLSKAQFRDLSAGPEDADDRILYNKTSGALFYDHDGAGGDAALQFAMIDNHAILDRGDFLVA